MPEKPLVWLGSARHDIRGFPVDARRRCGFQLRKLQQGLDPDDWKPVTSVGTGVREIRIRTEVAHRVFYVATFEEAVYVLHDLRNARPRPPRAMCSLRAIATAR